MNRLPSLRTALSNASRVLPIRANPSFSACGSVRWQSDLNVYDPKADESYEPPAKEVVRMPRFADFRSDTVTKPTAEMTIAMIDAQVGDDVYGEDPTVNKLQGLAAQMLEKEAALFVSSGTQGNLISIAAQTQRGEEVIVGDECHIFRYEQGGVSQLFGVPIHTIANNADGTFNIKGPKHSLFAALSSRGGGRDAHYPKPALVALENTHNRCGGAVLPLPFIDDVAAVCKQQGLKLHMDGARLMNAAAASGVPAARIVRDCDSVSLCLSKGLGAPVGSIIVGSKQFIERCHRLRKVLGGGMRQAGVVGASGIVALREHSKLLGADHAKAKSLARGLAGNKGVIVDPKRVQTNIVYFDLDPTVLKVDNLLSKAATGGEDAPPNDLVAAGTPLAAAFAGVLESVGKVKIGSYGDTRLRAVTHHQIRDEDIDTFLDAASKAVAWLS